MDQDSLRHLNSLPINDIPDTYSRLHNGHRHILYLRVILLPFSPVLTKLTLPRILP